MEGVRKAEGTKKVIEDAEASVSYLGVELPKAENRENAPRQEDYADYVNDAFSLELQRKLAIAFHQGDPILLEGGTSIGKTTTVKKMAAELGYEVHYVNLNGATDVEDLMGRYIPNKDKKGPNDPEYVFSDGKVTSGLRQEDGKVKIIILDEYNSAAPNVLIRLHEVLDALERGGEVVLSEDAAEKIPVSKSLTKVAALTNPPGKGYLQREPLDPAQLRRWVYQKEVTDLPEETLEVSARSLFGLEGTTIAPQQPTFTESAPTALTREQLAEIPGIQEILAKYLEFHKGAKELLASRGIARDQPQRFTFDDREEPKRVRDFIMSFYTGDLNATIQQALRYYYSGKLLDPLDKGKLDELIAHVEYTPPRTSARVPLGARPPRPLSHSEAHGEDGVELGPTRTRPEDPIPENSPIERISYEEAEKILDGRFWGVESVRGFLESASRLSRTETDRLMDDLQIPPIPFNAGELRAAKAAHAELILQPRFPSGVDGAEGISGRLLKRANSFDVRGRDFDEHVPDFDDMVVHPGWVLVYRGLGSANALDQFLYERDIIDTWGDTRAMPAEYTEALSELDRELPFLRSIRSSKELARELWKTKMNQYARQNPAEIIYSRIAQGGGGLVNNGSVTISNSVSPKTGWFVGVGHDWGPPGHYTTASNSPNFKDTKWQPSLVRRF